MRWNCWTLLNNLLIALCLNCISTYPWKHFRENFFSLKYYFFHHQFGIFSEYFSVKIFPTGFRILNFTCAVAIFDEKRFFYQKKVWPSSVMERKLVGFFAKHFQRGCQNCIGCVNKKNWEQKFSRKKVKSLHFWYTDRNNAGFLAIRLAGFANLHFTHFTCQENIYVKNIFFSICWSFSDIKRKKLTLSRFFSTKPSKLQFTCTEKQFNEKKTFHKNLLVLSISEIRQKTKILVLFVEMFWGRCPNCFVCAHRNTSRRKFLS